MAVKYDFNLKKLYKTDIYRGIIHLFCKRLNISINNFYNLLLFSVDLRAKIASYYL